MINWKNKMKKPEVRSEKKDGDIELKMNIEIEYSFFVNEKEYDEWQEDNDPEDLFDVDLAKENGNVFIDYEVIRE